MRLGYRPKGLEAVEGEKNGEHPLGPDRGGRLSFLFSKAGTTKGHGPKKRKGVTMKRRILVKKLVLALILSSFTATMASAESMIVTGYENPYLDPWGNVYNDYEYSAQAVFNLTGSVLTVTLTNTSSEAVDAPNEVLTGLLFNTTAGALDPVSARVLNWTSSDSHILNWNSSDGNAYPGSTDGTINGDVSSEWAFTAQNGISSSGLGLFGPTDLFGTLATITTTSNVWVPAHGNKPGHWESVTTTSGNTLWSPESPDGLQYGILPLAGQSVNANTGVTSMPLIVGGVVFTFDVVDTAFTLNDIHDVSFQYGTSPCEPNVPPVPEPVSAALIGLGAVALALRKRFV